MPTKTALTALAGASIALPSSLPFAIFSLDFGKEGAAVLSSILQVVGSLSALAFLKSFPDILRSRGWFGVHALLALMGLLASLSMGTVMFADSQKFSRGYVVRSSLLNESVVTLHACSRPECALCPMWRPGQRRPRVRSGSMRTCRRTCKSPLSNGDKASTCQSPAWAS